MSVHGRLIVASIQCRDRQLSLTIKAGNSSESAWPNNVQLMKMISPGCVMQLPCAWFSALSINHAKVYGEGPLFEFIFSCPLCQHSKENQTALGKDSFQIKRPA